LFAVLCHRWILRWFYRSHEKKHTELRSDGQQSEHVTAPPEDRFSGPLDQVPQGYVHSVCGVVTRMPEEIIRTYLVNPMTYSDGSFCCGCAQYVDSSQLVWHETGEKVMDYMGQLRLRYLRETLGMALPDRPRGIVLTTRAEQELKKILSSAGGPAFIALSMAEPGSPNFKLDIASSIQKRLETVIPISGIEFVVPKPLATRLSGVVIDLLEKPQRSFSICRLYAPSDNR
jgi:hypothetical protein